jgi:hypothetical protein
MKSTNLMNVRFIENADSKYDLWGYKVMILLHLDHTWPTDIGTDENGHVIQWENTD